MTESMKPIKLGLLLVMLTLLFGIGLGVTFGVAEGSVQSYIAQGIEAHPAVHDAKSQGKIWRYAQRAHFHATGIAAFSLPLLLLVLHSSMGASMKFITATLIGLGGFYPLSWFSTFLMAPELGRSAAHHHALTEAFVYIGVGGLLLGILILCGNLFLGLFREQG